LTPPQHAIGRPQVVYHAVRSTIERTVSRDDLDYQLLRHLTDEPAVSQRRLASRLGISVGKANYCLRALVDRGWVKANNFRRSDNKWAYAYLLTPSGAAAKVRLTRAFLARKEQEYESLQVEILELRGELGEAAGRGQAALKKQGPG
jgi:MarR family transcriptional regulator, temperature-dependent positive regulator of motility